MALTSGILGVTSRVVPLAVKPIVGNRGYPLYSHCGSPLLVAVEGPSKNRSFSSLTCRSTTKSNSNESLLQAIKSEIRFAVEAQEEEEAVDIPHEFPFKIDNVPGQKIITLRRQYQDEDITVVVYMPEDTDEEVESEYENEDQEGEGEGEEEEEEEEAITTCLPLVIRISKGGENHVLEFSCSAYADEIVIDSLSIKDPQNHDEQSIYEGPNFEDLDDKLQKEFYKYLKKRGITAANTNLLHEYMLNKEQVEYTAWLKKLGKFIQPST